MFTRIGFLFLIPFLYFLFSRILDVTVPQLHLPLIFGSVTLMATLLEGSLWKVLQFSTTRWLILFSFWFAVTTVAGLWKGGSFMVFRNYWLKSFIIFLALACLMSGLGRMRWALRTMMLGIFTSAVAGLLLNRLDREGRLRLPAGELANANFFGILMVLGLTFCWYVATHPTMSKPWRATALLFSLPIIYAAARTGSRAAFMAFALTFLFVFFQLPLGKKISTAFLVIPLLIGLVAVIPNYIQERLITTFHAIDPEVLGETVTDDELSAVASAQGRWYLLKRSITITIQNPVFGVGAGNFVVAEDLLAKEEDRPQGRWRVSHNGFTEVSSEMGVVGLILYCGAIISAWRMLRYPAGPALSHPHMLEIRHIAFSLRAALFCTGVAALLGLSLYSYYMPALLGLAVGFARWGNVTLAASREQSGAGGLHARTADPRRHRPWSRARQVPGARRVGRT